MQAVPDVVHVRGHERPRPQGPDGPEDFDREGSGLCAVTRDLARTQQKAEAFERAEPEDFDPVAHHSSRKTEPLRDF